jgi:hypothetical protein
MQRIIQPGALLGVAHIFQSANPNMTAPVAVANAQEFIRACHRMGLEVGPVAAFGPHEESSNASLDALDLAADMIEKDMGRKPWFPEGVKP